jgi:phosphoribosylaminoimidazole-succinocarboxamide synthase
MTERLIIETDLPLVLFKRGKVRDTWRLPGGNLLMVATDRISAFDVVVGAIPGKGKLLTTMSKFWFLFTERIIGNHFVSTDLSFAYSHDVWLHTSNNDLDGRSMVVKKVDWVIPVECVVRGYLVGSGWKEYQESGRVCGIELPPGLREGDKLPRPIFTPATKAEKGHDENISFEQMTEILEDRELAGQSKNVSLNLYQAAAAYAESKGIIIADTKFELGLKNDRLILIDEVLTPDSSRFWPKDEWQPGQAQKSFDKQYLRDWLVSIGWDKKPPAPDLPEKIVSKTSNKYQEALKRLIG